jgi:hypothetical protein
VIGLVPQNLLIGWIWLCVPVMSTSWAARAVLPEELPPEWLPPLQAARASTVAAVAAAAIARVVIDLMGFPFRRLRRPAAAWA